ncbi:MAG: polysaccharide biosynthesis tyrosine autokinase [Chthoniobacterales bacterium]|nr:polysaccharide biosynthesis tyrosine autokinase [Chthoniobacterales bacterium]
MKGASQSNDPFASLQENSEPFDWRHYLHIVLEKWWIVCLCLLLGGILSAFLISREQALYAARSVLFIEQQREQVLDGRVQAVRDDAIRSIDMINTVVETLNSYPMAERVAKRLELASDPAFVAAVEWNKEEKGELTNGAAAGFLVGKGGFVAAAYREMTRLIDIIARTPDPALSTKLANGYADEYLRMMLEQTTEATKSASQFLVEEAARLGAKMRLAEEAMQSFRERERASSLETMLAEAQATIDQTTVEIQQTEAFIRQLDADLAVVSSYGGDMQQLLRLPSVSSDPRVASMNAQVEALERELDEMGRRYREGHPAHTATKTRLEILRGNISGLVQEVIGQLEARRSQAESHLERLREKRAEAEKRLLEITGKSVEYNTLARNLETDRALYDSVLARLKEVDLTSGLTAQSITIQERALGAGPVPSQTIKFIVLGVVGGLAAGIGLAFGLNYLDPSLRTVDQVEQRTGVGTVAAVPRIKAKPVQGGGGAMLPAVVDRRGVVAEAFRTMRATLAIISGRDKHRVFLITSAIPGEGKTFTSSNFAATLAQQDFRTLLIDADLRKPSVSKLFFNENRKPGLSEVLLGNCTPEEAIIPTKIDKLWILPAGGIAPNPSELLAHGKLGELIDRLKGQYDRLVIDSSPVLAVRDPLLLAPFVDASCLIVRAGYSPSKASVQAVRLLAEGNVPATGIVLNAVRQGSGAYYAYSYRTYGTYGSKGVYGAASMDPTV